MEKKGKLTLKQRLALLEMLKTYFNVSELQEIYFALGVDYDALPGNNKADKARELILHLERRDFVDELLVVCEKLRPQLSWQVKANLPEHSATKSSSYELTDEEISSLYESGQSLEKAGLIYEAAAKYWVVKQARPNYPHVNLRLAVLEELPKKIFVNRKEEIGILFHLLKKSIMGTTTVAFLSGEAGIGKTSLAYEFFQTAQAKYENLIYAVSSCSVQSGFGEPYLPFKEILALLSGEIESQLAQADVSITNAKRLAQNAPLAVKLISEIAPNLINTLIPQSLIEYKQAQYGYSQDMRQKGEPQNALDLESPVSAFSKSIKPAISYEFSLVLRRLTENFPLILFFDDLHWGDTASIDLICYLASKLRDRPVMVVGAFRTEEITKTKKPLDSCINELKIHFPETTKIINLDTTSKTFVDQYIDQCYPSNVFPQDFIAQVQSHTAGNALFVSELFHLFEEKQKIIQNEKSVWALKGKVSLRQVPVKVETVIERRIESLTSDLRDILSAASVEGEEFTAQILAQLRQVGERDLIARLSEELEKKWHLVTLSRSTTLQKQRLYIYRFKHALIRTYLYQSMHPVKRELLHRDIGFFLEALYEKETEKFSPTLAEHFSQANLPEKEVVYRLVAAKHAAKIGAWNTAIYHLDQMEEKLNNESIAIQNQPEITMQMYKLRGNLFALIPDPDKALNDYRQLEIVANDYDNDCFLANAFCGYGVLERALGNFEKAIEFTYRVEEIASKNDCSDVLADCHLLAAKANKDLGEYDEVIRWARKAEIEYEQAGNLRGVLDSRSQIAYAHYARGQYETAESIWESNLEEAPEYANLPPDPDDDVYFCLGFLNWRLGKHEKAKNMLSTALESAQQTNNRRKQAYCLNNLGFVETSLGNFAKAENILTEALSVFQDLGDKKGESWALGNLGNVFSQSGKSEDAINYLKKNRALAEKIGLGSDKAEASRRLSEAFFQNGDLPEAYQFARLSLQEAHALKRRTFAGIAYRLLGRIAATAASEPLINLPDIEDPELYFEESVKIARETHNRSEESLSLKDWGNYLAQLPDEKSQSRGQAFFKQAEQLDANL